MEAVPVHAGQQNHIRLATTREFEMVDVSDQLAPVVAGSGIGDGVLHVFCPHTSCGLAVTELEHGLHADLEAVFDELAPTDREWRHDDMLARWQNIEPDERRNGWSHIRALLGTQPALALPISGGALALGRWQRVFLVELDGPRPARTVLAQAFGRPVG